MKTKFKLLKIAGVTTAVAVASSSVSAAIPEAVSTALTTAGTDVATLGGAVLLVVVAIVAFKFLKRAF